MDINKINDNYVLEAIELKPEKIKYLSSHKDIYEVACKRAIILNGNLINDVDYMYMMENLEFFFELVEIAKIDTPEIEKSPRVLFAQLLKNRQEKMNLIIDNKNTGTDINELSSN